MATTLPPSIHNWSKAYLPTHHFRQEGPLFIGQAPRQTFDSEQGGGSYVSGLPNFKGDTSLSKPNRLHVGVSQSLREYGARPAVHLSDAANWS